MNQMTRTTRQLVRPRIDSVDVDYRIEPVRPALRNAAIYVAMAALILALGILVIGYAILLNGGI